MNDHSLRVYDSIVGLQSSEENPTPLVRLNRVVPFKHAQVYAKLEWYNPFGAVKDRVAANLLADAEERGLIHEHQKLVEPTSGNTGMGLAMMANVKGYSLTTPLSKMIPQEKRTMLRFFGSNVIELNDTLCPAPGAPEGAIALAMETAEKPEFHMLNQYANEANPEAHYKTTGPEVWRQTRGEVTHFIAGLGTCGTITGTGRFLKEKDPKIVVLGVHPEEGHDIPGVRSLKQLEQTQLFRPDEYDELVLVTNQEAFDLCFRLNREESIIAGPSSGMALQGAFKLVPDEPGVVAVVIFPDNAFKYASSMGKHLPQVRSQDEGPQVNPREQMMNEMIENAKKDPSLSVAVEEARELLQNGSAPFVVDVREFDEYEKGYIDGAINLPLSTLGENAGMLPPDKETPILAVCARGIRSVSGVLYLSSLGYRNVKSMRGGTAEWSEKGYPLETL